MTLQLRRIRYRDLNGKQKENYNYQKISAVLADYGFVTMRLSDDWHGADFIAQHINGETFLKIQLKSRLTFGAKYLGKNVFIVFHSDGEWYLYPHDELLNRFLTETKIIGNTKSWNKAHGYSFPYLSKQAKDMLKPYKIFPFEKLGPNLQNL
jgi:hypothetical protein